MKIISEKPMNTGIILISVGLKTHNPATGLQDYVLGAMHCLVYFAALSSLFFCRSYAIGDAMNNEE